MAGPALRLTRGNLTLPTFEPPTWRSWPGFPNVDHFVVVARGSYFLSPPPGLSFVVGVGRSICLAAVPYRHPIPCPEKGRTQDDERDREATSNEARRDQGYEAQNDQMTGGDSNLAESGNSALRPRGCNFQGRFGFVVLKDFLDLTTDPVAWVPGCFLQKNSSSRLHRTCPGDHPGRSFIRPPTKGASSARRNSIRRPRTDGQGARQVWFGCARTCVHPHPLCRS